MKFVKQFSIILAFAFIGEVLHAAIPLPVPASIYGILLLFLALDRKWLAAGDIREAVGFLIQLMPVLFVPPRGWAHAGMGRSAAGSGSVSGDHAGFDGIGYRRHRALYAVYPPRSTPSPAE